MTEIWQRLSRYFGIIAIALSGIVVLNGVDAGAVDKVLPNNSAQVEYSYAPLVKKVAPAVVNIYTRRTIRDSGSPFFNDPFFRRFFGDSGFGEPRERQQSSLGSGVIVGADGVVATNRHVIEGADEITVVLSDRREFSATVILEDERSDLAVLRIDTGGHDLPSLEFRDSDTIEVGDIVFAIGNPFGVGQTVTSGIVSAVARSDIGISDYEFFIQTDAAINPGNSGGALVGMDGTLFGINTVILSRSGGSHGIGFAIPANMIARIVESALTDGKVIRPWLGATGQMVSSDIAEAVGLDRPMGVLINAIYEGGAADKAGLATGDIVTEVLGKAVNNPKSLASRLATNAVGGIAVLKVYSADGYKDLEVPLVEAPRMPAPDETTLVRSHPFGGATVVNLSPGYNEELHIDMMLGGVMVTNVERGGRAYRVGLRTGDIFVIVGDEQIETVAQLDDGFDRFQSGDVIKIRRRGRILEDTLR